MCLLSVKMSIVQNKSCQQIDLQTQFSQESVLHACLQDSFSVPCKQRADKAHRLAGNSRTAERQCTVDSQMFL